MLVTTRDSREMACFALLGGLVGFLLSGCSGGGTVPVSGRVTLDGEGLEHVAVTFTPLAGGTASSGTTDAEGRFTLKSISESASPGAVVGKHRVTLAEVEASLKMRELGPEAGINVEFKLPPQARDGSIIFEVPPEGTSSANFEFRSDAS